MVVLANLSGFDGSPESMRKLQLEYGAEIARAVVNFAGPIVFLVVSRYHGGAYVVFSQALNPNLRAAALEGSYASVIGGGPAAAVVFTREVRARALADPRVVALERALRASPGPRRASASSARSTRSRSRSRRRSPPSSTRIHTVERARGVGSLSAILRPADARVPGAESRASGSGAADRVDDAVSRRAVARDLDLGALDASEEDLHEALRGVAGGIGNSAASSTTISAA